MGQVKSLKETLMPRYLILPLRRGRGGFRAGAFQSSAHIGKTVDLRSFTVQSDRLEYEVLSLIASCNEVEGSFKLNNTSSV